MLACPVHRSHTTCKLRAGPFLFVQYSQQNSWLFRRPLSPSFSPQLKFLLNLCALLPLPSNLQGQTLLRAAAATTAAHSFTQTHWVTRGHTRTVLSQVTSESAQVYMESHVQMYCAVLMCVSHHGCSSSTPNWSCCCCISGVGPRRLGQTKTRGGDEEQKWQKVGEGEGEGERKGEGENRRAVVTYRSRCCRDQWAGTLQHKSDDRLNWLSRTF